MWRCGSLANGVRTASATTWASRDRPWGACWLAFGCPCWRIWTGPRVALGAGVKHRRTRAYRPQTNGKVERFNRTLATEWAYATIYDSDEARAATYEAWLHHYTHHRPHTGIGGQVPSARVHNLTAKNT